MSITAKARLALTLLITLVPVMRSQQYAFQILPGGLEVFWTSSMSPSAGNFHIRTVLRLDLGRYFDVLTVDPNRELVGIEASHAYSLQELANHDPDAVALSNGGATSSFNIPIS